MNESDNHIIAKWSDRFFAWLIDFVIISSISTSVIFMIFGTMEFEENSFWAESTQYIPSSILFFFILDNFRIQNRSNHRKKNSKFENNQH